MLAGVSDRWLDSHTGRLSLFQTGWNVPPGLTGVSSWLARLSSWLADISSCLARVCP